MYSQIFQVLVHIWSSSNNFNKISSKMSVKPGTSQKPRKYFYDYCFAGEFPPSKILLLLTYYLCQSSFTRGFQIVVPTYTFHGKIAYGFSQKVVVSVTKRGNTELARKYINFGLILANNKLLQLLSLLYILFFG